MLLSLNLEQLMLLEELLLLLQLEEVLLLLLELLEKLWSTTTTQKHSGSCHQKRGECCRIGGLGVAHH